MRILPIFMLFFLSCTTRVHPPETGEVNIYLVDHGRHASLILQFDKDYYRYAYGDWDFYAEASPGFWNGLKAILWPTRGALGRRFWQSDGFQQQLPDGAEAVYLLRVEQAKARALQAELDKIYQANLSSRRSTPEYNLDFVEHPETYWGLNNSNQMVGRWLRQLGCELDGKAILSRWEVKARKDD
jgi:hypothetical protein